MYMCVQYTYVCMRTRVCVRALVELLGKREGSW